MSVTEDEDETGETSETAEMEKRVSLPVGVIVERREIDNPWQRYAFRPVAVFLGAPEHDPRSEWTLLREGEGWAHFHAATMPLELFRGETGGYVVNLNNPPPRVFVILSPGSEANDPEFVAQLVTVCPYEAESYTEDTDQLVEGVPMPEEIFDLVRAFCDSHHKEVQFKKRQRKPYDPRKGDFRQRGAKGGFDA